MAYYSLYNYHQAQLLRWQVYLDDDHHHQYKGNLLFISTPIHDGIWSLHVEISSTCIHARAPGTTMSIFFKQPGLDTRKHTKANKAVTYFLYLSRERI